jgi:hypothetical protein
LRDPVDRFPDPALPVPGSARHGHHSSSIVLRFVVHAGMLLTDIAP